MTVRTRFAPSPTGPLHLGHAYSALMADDLARRLGGEFLLRIEDIDQARARDAWEAQIYEDLTWLGLRWPKPVLRQSDNQPAYQDALSQLRDMDVLYGCECTRKDIQSALSAPQEGGMPVLGPDGLIYPGTCRSKNLADDDVAWRLDMKKAVNIVGKHILNDHLLFIELGDSTPLKITAKLNSLPDLVGDIVIARRNMGTSYHLSVVVDDHAQSITHVVRGKDLFEATQIHVLLQALLGLPTPTYLHHELILDEAGKRLAKRDDARALSKYRDEGKTPQDIRRMVGLE